MAGGQQLGALISLTQGLDMSPLNSARSFQIERQKLAQQMQQALGSQGLEQQRIDLAREQGKQNLALADRELTQQERLAQQQQEFLREQGTSQRDLDRELAKLQLEGRVDLQELVGAQEIARVNLEGMLDEKQQAAAFEFKRKQDENLMKFEGDKFDKEFGLKKEETNRRLDLLEKQGDREGLRLELEQESERLKNLLLQRQTQNLPSALEAGAQRQIELDIMHLEFRKLTNELDGQLSPESMKELNRIQLELAREEVAGAKSRRRGEDVQTAGFEAQLADAGFKVERDDEGNITGVNKVEKAEEGTDTDTGPVSKKDEDAIINLNRLVENEDFTDTDIGFLTGNNLALNALTSLESFAGDEAEVAEDRQRLRELAKLGRKLGKGNVGGTLSDAESVFGPPSFKGAFRSTEEARKASGMTDEEISRMLALIEHFKDRGIELVD